MLEAIFGHCGDGYQGVAGPLLDYGLSAGPQLRGPQTAPAGPGSRRAECAPLAHSALSVSSRPGWGTSGANAAHPMHPCCLSGTRSQSA